jgi:hypothetical protein
VDIQRYHSIQRSVCMYTVLDWRLHGHLLYTVLLGCIFVMRCYLCASHWGSVELCQHTIDSVSGLLPVPSPLACTVVKVTSEPLRYAWFASLIRLGNDSWREYVKVVVNGVWYKPNAVNLFPKHISARYKCVCCCFPRSCICNARTC